MPSGKPGTEPACLESGTSAWRISTSPRIEASTRRSLFPKSIAISEFSTRPAITVGPQTYLTDFLTDRAIKFIEANKTRPFFLYLPHYAVHSPVRAKEDLIARYRMKKPAGEHRDPVYAAMIHSIDEGVGRIMARLKELDLDERTVVIFYSDDGGAGGYERDGVEWFSPTSNHPLRGGKGMLYEGGVRVPLIVRWPGVVAPGSICSEPVTSTDFFPTFLTLAGRETDRNRPVDGLSLVPLLQKGGTASLHREALFWHYPSYLQANAEKGTWRITPAGAIRSGDFKLLEFFEDGRLELYDLRNDIGETRNLALQMPAKDKGASSEARWLAPGYQRTYGDAEAEMMSQSGVSMANCWAFRAPIATDGFNFYRELRRSTNRERKRN